MRVTILGSGSRGNATLVEAGATRVLVDAGISARQVRLRAEAARGAPLDGIDAIVLTHGHGDHVGHARTIAKAFEAPVYLTEATRRNPRLSSLGGVRVFGPNTPFTIGELSICPCSVPHDAPQVALVFQPGGDTEARAALVTDLGEIPPALLEHLRGVATVLFESNHDPALLAAGPYPEALQRRILSGVGHLSNAQAGEGLAALAAQRQGLREVVLMHISQKNNLEGLARAAAEAALAGHDVTIRVARQDTPLVIDVAAAPPRPRDGQLALGFDSPA